MKGIGIIGEMIPGVILGGILLGVVSSSVLLPPLLYLVAPLLSFAHYSLPLLIRLPREGGLILESSGDQAVSLQPRVSPPSKRSESAGTCSTDTANN